MNQRLLAGRGLVAAEDNIALINIAFIERDLKVSRLTATKYLDALAEQGFLQKQKIGRTNYYINVALNRILIGTEMGPGNV